VEKERRKLELDGKERRKRTYCCSSSTLLRCTAGQTLQDLAGDTRDRVVDLGRHLLDENGESLDDIGAKERVGEVERSDEEREKLLRRETRRSGRRYWKTKAERAHLGKFGKRELLRDVLKERREGDEVDGLSFAVTGSVLISDDELRKEEREEALLVEEL
jgi:hypothetical protein